MLHVVRASWAQSPTDAIKSLGPPTSKNPATATPPVRLPSLAAFRDDTLARAKERADRAWATFSAARASPPVLELEAPTTGTGALQSGLMGPEFGRSLSRRVDQRAAAERKRKQAWEQQVRDLRALAHGAVQIEVGMGALFADGVPPPRVVALVGDPFDWLALPVLDLHPMDLRAPGLDALTPNDLPAPICRGRDLSDRLFLAIAFERQEARGAEAGLVLLAEVNAREDGPWFMLNPQRFTPPGWRYTAPLAPPFPAMWSRGTLAGSPDAQAMLRALYTLLTDGQLGPYRLLRR